LAVVAFCVIILQEIQAKKYKGGNKKSSAGYNRAYTKRNLYQVLTGKLFIPIIGLARKMHLVFIFRDNRKILLKDKERQAGQNGAYSFTYVSIWTA